LRFHLDILINLK